MTGAKKIWQRPEMTVLVRSNPEEAVLQTCKTTTINGPDTPSEQQQCYRADNEGWPQNCAFNTQT